MEKILVLCSGNSSRSQMAEGILRHLGGKEYEVQSAGVRPSTVNPYAVKVMAEIGLDISGHTSKSADIFKDQKFDHVITVCENARQTCPVYPGEYEKIHWDVADPVEAGGTDREKTYFFRKIRNIIKERAIEFLKISKNKAQLKCPACKNIQEVDIPQNACLGRHKCGSCGNIIVPTEGSCCVICAYSDKNCPIFPDR